MTPLCYVMMEIMRSPSMSGLLWVPKKTRDILTWSIHFRTSKRSFEAVWSLQGLPKMPFMIHHFGPSNSGHFFLEPQENAPKINILGGGDIRYSPNVRWIFYQSWSPGLSRSRSPRFFSAVKRSRLRGPPVCRIPHCTVVKSWIFSVGKLFKTGSKWAPTDVHAICFPRKSCSSVQVKKDVLCPVGWNNASFRFWDANPWFSHCTGGGSIPRDLTVRWNRLWIFILNLCSLHRPLAAQSWVSIFAVLLMMLIRRGKDEETRNVHVLLCKIDIKNRRNCLPMTQIVIYKHWNSWFKNSLSDSQTFNCLPQKNQRKAPAWDFLGLKESLLFP